MTLKEQLDALPDNERRRLVYAFEAQLTQTVQQKDGTFIGVNVRPSKTIEILQTCGQWVIGRNK